MRNKISAGDLLSAESILEVHREKNGEDANYVAGLSWLARGALLLGEDEKADRYVKDVRARVAERLAKGDTLSNSEVATPFGAAIEVAAQRIAESRSKKAAVEFIRSELAQIPNSLVSLRSRLHKRINLLSMAGTKAPELEVEDFLGDKPEGLAALHGKPVVVFLWAEWCADCRAQAASLARVKAHYEKQGVQVVAVTRYFEKNVADRAREKARVDSVWNADYKDVGPIPRVFSTASMERYGVSSTPTFVFVDRDGIVRRYTPTRLTEEEFDRTLTTLVP
jgi:thiol-disulfide isomerase/thioredoxin